MHPTAVPLTTIVITQASHPRRPRISPLVLLVIAILLVPARRLPAAGPQLTSVFPLSCRPGESVSVKISGQQLDKPTALIFDTPTVTAKRLPTGEFLVSVAAESVPKECDVWCLAGSQLSNPRRFVITRLQRDVEGQENGTPETAQEVAVPGAIDGRLETKARRDWFQFTARQGQQLAIRCRSQSLDGAVAPVLVVYDASGRELAHSGGRRIEPLIILTMPRDGIYRLRVSDRSYQAVPASFYRLELFSGPYAAAVFPNLFQSAVPAEVSLYGIGLALNAPQPTHLAGGLRIPTMSRGTIPAISSNTAAAWQAATELFPRVQLQRSPLFAKLAAARPSVAVTHEPVVLENEAQTFSLTKYQSLEVPSLLNGRFDHTGDIDWYALRLQKGDAVRIDIYGDRFGLPTDLDASVLDAKGKTLITFPDLGSPKGLLAALSTGSLDVSAVWQAPSDGVFRLVVRDLYGSSVAGVDRCYVLHVHSEVPGFRVTALPPEGTLPSGISVPQGGRTGWRMAATRYGGFSGEIRIAMKPNTAPPGLALDTCWFGPNQTETTCVLSADTDAVLGARMFDFEAHATLGKQTLRQSVRITTLTDSQGIPARRMRHAAAAISNPSRLGVSLEPATQSVVIGQTLNLHLRRTQLVGTLKKPAKIHLPTSPLTAAKPLPSLAPDAEVVAIALQVPKTLAPGRYTIAALVSGTLVMAATAGEKPTEESVQAWSNTVAFQVQPATKSD